MQIEKQGLNKKEKALMRAIYLEAEKRDGLCLMTPIDILSQIPYDIDFKEAELESTLKILEMDDYLDKVNSDKKGSLVYCITLHKKGLAFKRREDLFRRNIYFKIGITIVFAILSGIVGFTIKSILGAIIG